MQQKDEDGDSAVKAALRSALSLLKRKVISSSSDLVGIMLYGTVCIQHTQCQSDLRNIELGPMRKATFCNSWIKRTQQGSKNFMS